MTKTAKISWLFLLPLLVFTGGPAAAADKAVIRDLVVAGIYGVALTLHVYHWAQWQNRAKPKAEVVATTAYGRPLARKS